MDSLEVSFQLILHSGNARSYAMEAITLAKKRNFTAALKSLEESGKELTEAHNIQTTLLQTEASGTPIDLSILLVHAQDHLMNSITVKDLAGEMVELYSTIEPLRKEDLSTDGN
ncbi:PTS system cellobiose-specific IIA component [Bacillus pakistanensis]|uniref:PTS system cellobiose-specific IIA component n=1 Tax=Rossellomorea pakistanensis TaxID=992288 RepID=A0ABS2NJA7_9BACI|nr:PTS lactose/cellobiose transporter subunit IIA [Bacillus pakistanensis]MBM7587915.1 PTS system cellobiose-specific IIA component [Bacillus pakistanensis]